MKYCLLALLTFSYFSSAARSGGIELPVISDFSQVTMSLLTVEPGPDLYMRFGHTGIRVTDPKNGMDAVFNWGEFDFNEPNFGLKFFRGILLYRMGAAPYPRFITLYKRYELRDVWEDNLSFTDVQKAEVWKQISWWAKAENNSYHYHYFYNNCSTIVRDIFDSALKGALKQRFENRKLGRPFRSYVRSNLGTIPGVALSLDVLMNGNVELEMTAWSEMFLPERLRDHLLPLPALNDQGFPIAESKLLADDRKVVDSDTPQSGWSHDYTVVGLLWGLPMFLGFVFGMRRKMDVARRLLGWGGVLWGLVAGAYGLVMLVSWLFSVHLDLHHNMNLLLFNPLDFTYVGLGMSWLRGRFTAAPSVFLRRLSQLHLLLLVGLALAMLLKATTQDSWPLWLHFGLPMGLFMAMLLRWGGHGSDGVRI